MSYEVKTRVFEGPLDLLLQLITSHQVEITELSLVDLVGEYLSHLDAMDDMDIEVTSEFLLIAATLIQMKARYLLPDDREIDLDDELALAEERDRLLARLLACLTFKDVAAVFGHRLDGNARFVPRLAGLDPDITPLQPEVKLDITLEQFVAIAERAFQAAPDEPDLDHLDLELPSVNDAIADVRIRVAAAVETEFDELVAHCDRTIDVVAYFLALLELARWGVVSVDQEHRDAPIRVVSMNSEAYDKSQLQSEWSE
ncbi:MAG: ScpA family protein [Actinomycetota bacterium]|nr:ScpA family protein [Actinomycetota bacterium]